MTINYFDQSVGVLACHSTGQTTIVAMMQFGQLLKDLRLARGFTQETLAAAAGLSVGTIVRNERAEKSQLTRSNLTRVLEALESKRPLSAAEAAVFQEVTQLLVVNPESVNRSRSSDELLAAFLASLSDPVERQCYETVDQLITDFGTRTALGAIEGAAGGLRARIQASPPRPGLIVHSAPRIEDGMEVRVISPAPKQDPPDKKRRASDG